MPLAANTIKDNDEWCYEEEREICNKWYGWCNEEEREIYNEWDGWCNEEEREIYNEWGGWCNEGERSIYNEWNWWSNEASSICISFRFLLFSPCGPLEQKHLLDNKFSVVIAVIIIFVTGPLV